jgi:hypothetical protein
MKSYTDGRTKFIKFSDTVDVEAEEDENVKASGIDIKIRELGFSVISQICKTERKEIAYIFMKNIIVEYLNTPKWKKINFSIDSFQIDNQINYNILFPVMFRTNNRKKNMPAIEVNVILRNDTGDILFLEETKVSISESEIKIDDELLKVFYKFARDIAGFMDTTVVKSQNENLLLSNAPQKINRLTHGHELELSPTKRRSSFKDMQELVKEHDRLSGFVSMNYGTNRPSGNTSFTNNISSDVIKEEKWEKVNLREKATSIYIKSFEATELNLDVSFIARFRSDIKFTSDQVIRNHNFFQSIGLALSTIENAPIRIRKLHLKNVFGSQKDIGYLFSDYYSSSIKKNLVTIIGSTEILGNPVNFVRTVGTGLHDFVHEPIDGFRSGVAKGGIGILKGTGSLVKNTAVGTFGTLSKFSSSISKGILIFTRDEEFIYQREGQLMSEKPKNIVEGVGYGVKRALKSIQGAVFGIVTHPIKGARREGAKGFFKGTWTGVSGIFIKPIAGGLDLIAKTTDGIKYNFKIFDEKNNDERIRWPRPFYGNELKITSYNSIDSYVLVYLNKMYKKDMLKNPFVDSMILNEFDRRRILVFTTQHFLLIEMKKKNITWVIDKDEIESVIKFNNGIKIKLNTIVQQSRIPNFARRPQNDDYFKIEYKIIGNFIFEFF